MMSSPLKKQPEAVADKVLKRVEVSKIARRLQGRLALAQFKTKHGWEDLTLDTLEPKLEEEIRRKRQTPPMRNRTVPNRRNKDRLGNNGQKSGEEGADLLLYLAASPSPAVPSTKTRMDPPSTPPPKKDLALPSSMMTTPGGGNLFPTTPGQPFDISDFVNITPSPAQKPWKTPVSLTTAKTPLGRATRKLTFEGPLH
ncbi:putative nrm1-like protein [Eutypa lata UCREL1]|uniref:Putative nrm1-like protein n=1 Tax=Eutypa lata (strain UCR-EL1) TaxID=1287681 RepID=M7SH48_EUTLA|nr:putative nrm1-like protein [Eutypa lata UCREL1]